MQRTSTVDGLFHGNRARRRQSPRPRRWRNLMSSVALNGGLNRVAAFYESVIGKKVVMAVTGFILFGFVLSHMLANLQVFVPVGADGIPALDKYAEHLRDIPPLLWGARVVLLVSVILHIVAAWQLTV